MRHILCITTAILALAACTPQRGAEGAVGEDGPSLLAARSALTEGQAGTSLAIARGILQAQPNNVAAMSQAGDAEAALGDRLAAAESYRQALRLAPQNVRARLGMGKLELRDNVPAAEQSFRAILVDAPRDPVVMTDLGYALDLQERHAEAQRLYAQALQIDPNHMAARVNLALSLALSGQPERAEQMLRDVAASANSTQKMRLDLAAAQVIAGHDKDAAVLLTAELGPQEAKQALDGLTQLRIAPVPAMAKTN